MVDLLEQRLSGERLAAAHDHMATCAACRELVAASAGALDSSGGLVDEPTHISPPKRAWQSDLGPGSRVDHYRIERLIGQGGMGHVYQAHDATLDRKVALKIIKPELLVRDNGFDMLMTEARATARLAHPHIVTIHGVSAYQGQPYVALELLVGQTLRERLLLGPLSHAEVVHIALAIAEALAAAHAASVLHRDLKPGNVMLCADGRPRVLDFGLAVLSDVDLIAAATNDAEASFDETIMLAGTPAYMAPEQWGKQVLTPAADVWALGMVMFEMCTGVRPYDHLRVGSSTEALLALARAIKSDAPVPFAERMTAVAPELQELIRVCLAKDPLQRPTASAVVEALQSMLWQRTVSAMRLPPPSAPRRWPLMLSAVLLVGIGLLYWQLRIPPPAVRAPAATRQPAVEMAQPSTDPPPSDATTASPPVDGRRPLPKSQPSTTTSASPSWDPMSYR